MAKGRNLAFIHGNVGTQPELRFTANGTPVLSLRVATPTRRKQGEDFVDDVVWHTVVFWRQLAEIVDKYVSKGDRIDVTGEIRYKDYEGSDGTQYKNTAEIHAQDMILCGGRGAGVEASDDGPAESDDDLPF